MASKYFYILKKFLLETTSHGLPNIIRAKHFALKIMWTIFVLLATLASIYMVKNAIRNFLQFEVVTKITMQKEFKTKFPTITICNRNLFTKPEDRIYLDENYEKIKHFTFTEKQIFFAGLAFNFSIKNNVSVGLKLKELIVECSFNQKECDYENDFVEAFYHLSGTCFRYNSGLNSNGQNTAIKEVNQAGTINGLRLKVFTGFNEFSYPSDSTGLHIMIHNSSIKPTSMEGFDIPTGLESNIALNRLFIYKKENPYSDCIADIQKYIPDFYSQVLKNGFEYRQDQCLGACYQSLLIKKYGCYNPTLPQLNSTKPCLSPDDALNSAFFYLNEFSKNYLFQYCEPSCPLECNSVQYNTLISHSDFPTLYYLNVSGLNYTSIDTFKRNHLSLNVFYDSLTYTTIEELAKTELIDLISSIGGTLGLFIGVSVLSMAESFELIFLLIEALFKKKDVLPLYN